MSEAGSTTAETRSVARRYRIQNVSEITGVPTATLRAWERRYGIPEPGRSEGGYRLYTERDVELVRQLRGMTERGVAPSEAARQLQASFEPPDVPMLPPHDRDNFELVIERILDAVHRFDPDALESELKRALILGSTLEIYERVMVPAMFQVGQRWQAGELSVAQEHLASEVLRCIAQDLHRLAQPTAGYGLAVLACFAEEQHVLPLYGLAFHLAHRGVRSIVLGARTPPEAIAMAVERLKPTLVGLSVTVPPPPRVAKKLIDAYAAACQNTRWLVGGAGVASLTSYIEDSGGQVCNQRQDLEQFLDERELFGRR